MSDWAGESPIYLVIAPDDPDAGNIGIDVDAGGWISENQALFRTPSTWFLMSKVTSTPLFAVVIEDGDQAFFVKHHVGNLMAGIQMTSYGLGKKKADGSVTKLWLLPNGWVCGSEEDVDVIMGRMLS